MIPLLWRFFRFVLLGPARPEHAHEWEQWGAPAVYAECENDHASYNMTATLQRRTCKSCGLIDQRKIGRASVKDVESGKATEWNEDA